MSLTALYDLPAPAKLNTFLHVVGRREDGYHLLESAMLLIDWCDTLHIKRRGDRKLRRIDLAAHLPADDLCLRAAQALQRESGSDQGAEISIEKRVPAGAGMGGGSSDAATTLLALNRLWGLNWSRRRLSILGLSLGADVPFFLGGSNAFVQGVGEQLTPLAIAPQWLAVVKPAVNIDTKAVYESPLLRSDTPAVILASLFARGDSTSKSNAVSSPSEVFFSGKNDLQQPAMSLSAEIGQSLQWLEEQFGNARMTGSGSGVFAWLGSVESAAEVKRSIAALPESLPLGCMGRMCRSLEQHPLRGWVSD